jgi:predicted ATPase
VGERAGASSGVVGREDELVRLREYLEGRESVALLITGGPGIGKTTLWEAGVDLAREEGRRVLTARPSGAEAQLGFAALIDLLDGVETTAIAGLPSPQRRALDAALLRAEPGSAPREGAISLAFLNAIRALAADEPLLIAIDDLQWLDRRGGRAARPVSSACSIESSFASRSGR